MHYKDKPVIWLHPVTGDYKIPMHNTDPMPSRYEMAGYIRKEFDSSWEHASWMKKVGLVNHAAEGISVDKDALGKNRWGY